AGEHVHPVVAGPELVDPEPLTGEREAVAVVEVGDGLPPAPLGAVVQRSPLAGDRTVRRDPCVRELGADELLPPPAQRLLDRLLLVPAVPLEVEVHPREVAAGETAGVAQQGERDAETAGVLL